MDKVTLQMPEWKYTVILIIFCLGDPDIIDGIVKVLMSLSERLLE